MGPALRQRSRPIIYHASRVVISQNAFIDKRQTGLNPVRKSSKSKFIQSNEKYIRYNEKSCDAVDPQLYRFMVALAMRLAAVVGGDKLARCKVLDSSLLLFGDVPRRIANVGQREFRASISNRH